MGVYAGINDTIKGERIYCVFEKSTKPSLLSTQGRHNAQQMTIKGNPAIATILKKLRYAGK